MKTLCVLATFQTFPDAVVQGRAVSDWVATALERSFPGVSRVSRGPWIDAAAFLEDLQNCGEGVDELVVVPADAPFLRPDVMDEMLALHREYRADYTFADGYPGGFTPEILKPSILPLLRSWAKGPADREALFRVLSTDINRFDVETQLSPVDLRARRLGFTADTKRGRVLLDRYAADTVLDTSSLLKLLETSVERTRTLPATLHVQVCDGVLQLPVWSPQGRFAPDALSRRAFLSRAQWNTLLDQAVALAGDLTVLPSFWGEPSLHPEIGELLADAAAKPGVTLCIETSGLGWGSVNWTALAPRLAGRVEWIVELDSNQPEQYRRLRGDGFEEAQALTRTLIQHFPGHVWPQTVRMKDNEPEMESFFQTWKEAAGQVIIQKHNDFGGRLPRLKPSNLAPWKRHACWHLARDLAVFLDGTAVVCRDDFDRTQPLGNVWKEPLEAVWARGDSLFARHAREDWPEVCRNCDEWYTFHF